MIRARYAGRADPDVPNLPIHMKRLLTILALALLAAAPAAAQFADEAKFNQAQAKKLNAYAKKAFKKGFPRKAKRVWLQVLKLYDPDNADAHEALGEVKVGKSWNPRSDFTYPSEDKPDPGAAKALRSEWGKLAKALGSAHSKLAKEYDAAGRTDRSRYHFEQTIRYTPSDVAAMAALEHKPVEGLSGTDLEKTLYERSKMIEAAIEAQFKVKYDVEVLPEDDTHPILNNAQLPHRSVRSEHFTVRGEFEVEVLTQAAEHAERAIRVAAEVFDGYDGFFTDVANWPKSELLFVAGKDTFRQVLDANTDSYMGDQEDFNFTRKESASASFRMQNGFASVQVGSSEVGIYDGAVRNVAQFGSQLGTTAMREGIGHTIVGMFFNNNRLFAIDRQRQIKTSTEDEAAYNSPNFDEWKDLALESAWKKAGTPAAELPLFKAHSFPNEARIKAWSFCDYLLRRDPSLLLALDRININKDVNNPTDIQEKFTKQNDGLTIAQLEKEWRDYWTEASPVLAAIRNNKPPLDSVSKDVKKWLEGFNEARKEFGSPAVSWSSSYSSRCAEHANYLKVNKKQRGPAAEHMQDTDLEGGSHLGNMFAQMAIVETKAKKPDDVFEEWVKYPGYRDALMSPFLWTIGMFAERGILVMDVVRGVRGESKREGGGYNFFPRDEKAVPNEVAVAELGPRVEKLLADNGKAGKKKIGLPMSFHGFQSGLVGNRNSYVCTVSHDGEKVEGILDVGASGGSNRHTSAPGMVVFYPFEPLKRGAQYRVAWSFTKGDGQIERLNGKFTTK